MVDLISLYSKKILSLAADIPHTGRLPEPEASVTKRSPLCGSTITIDLAVEDGHIAAFGQDVKACALGQASAAVLGEHAIGLTLDEARTVREDLRAMLKDGAKPPKGKFEKLKLLEPARDYKNRHASIMLAYDATVEAMESVGAGAAAQG
jgi:NifU-like protein involved in Fe-S cluster formation